MAPELPEKKTSQESTQSLWKFLELEEETKMENTDSSLEFTKACEDLLWNHCTSRPHRCKTDGIAERAEEDWKKERLLFSYSQDWMNNVAPMQWNGIDTCTTFRICFVMGKLLPSADLANTSQNLWNYLEQKWNVIPLLRKTKRGFINLGRKSSQAFYWDLRWKREGREIDILAADAEELPENYALEACVKRISANEITVVKRGRQIQFPMRRCNDKVDKKRFRSSHILSNSAKSRKDGRTHQSSSRTRGRQIWSCRTTRCNGSEEWFLDCFWKLFLSTSCPKTTVFMCFKETHFLFHWNTLTLFGEQTLHWTHCRPAEWMIIGTLMVTRNYQGHGPIHPTHNIESCSTSRCVCVPVREKGKIQPTSRPEYIWPKDWEQFITLLWNFRNAKKLQRKKKRSFNIGIQTFGSCCKPIFRKSPKTFQMHFVLEKLLLARKAKCIFFSPDRKSQGRRCPRVRFDLR